MEFVNRGVKFVQFLSLVIMLILVLGGLLSGLLGGHLEDILGMVVFGFGQYALIVGIRYVVAGSVLLFPWSNLEENGTSD